MPSLSAMKDLDAADALPKGLGEPIRPKVKTERERKAEKRQSEISNFETMKDTVKEAAKPAPKGLPVAKPMFFDADAFQAELNRQREIVSKATHGADYSPLEARVLAHAARTQDFAKYFEEQFQQRPAPRDPGKRSAGSSSFDEMYRQVFGMARDRTEVMKTGRVSMAEQARSIIKGRRDGVLTFDDYNADAEALRLWKDA